MRDFQLQTPHKDQNSANRQQKSTPDLNKNLRKVTKKSSNPAFKAISEDDFSVLESLKEFAEASVENPFGESAENFIVSVHPVDANSSETVAISDLTSQSPLISSITTSHEHEVTNDTNTSGSPEVDSSNNIGSVETEVVIKHLREARVLVLKSKDVGPSKKLLEALINIIIEEFHGGLYEGDEWFDIFMSRKSNPAILSLGMVILAIFMFWFFNSSSMGSFTTPTGPTPT